MNWILALLAFAGIMVILSTIVSVAVEAVHKGFSLRKNGLQEMLRALHDHVIVDIDQHISPTTSYDKANGGSSNAQTFADDVTMSPCYTGNGPKWWPSNWPINVSRRRFERLTRRQLAEQLAQSEFGKKLALQSRSRIQHTLGRINYEFDRLGAAHSMYFRARAKLLSGLTAFAFVILANINVVDVYFHLATNEQALDRALAAVEADNTNNLIAITEKVEEQARAITAEIETGDSTAALQEAAVKLDDYLKLLNGDLDLPVGRSYFPYCENPLADAVRCAKPIPEVRLGPVEIPQFLVRFFLDLPSGLVWLMSMIASAGLLAMGAPFWFSLFNKIAAIVGSTAASRVANVRAAANAEVNPTPKQKVPPRIEDPDDLDELADAFLIASGRPFNALPGSAVTGRKLGAPSSEFVPQPTRSDDLLEAEKDEQEGGGDDALHAHGQSIRGVRGDWSGK